MPQGDGGRTSFRLPDALVAGKTYYWRTRREDGANTGWYSAPVSFVIEAPVVLAPPVLVSPVGGQRIGSSPPTFRFRVSSRSGPAGTVIYGLEVSANESFTDKYGVWVVTEQAGEVVFTPVLGLPYDKAVFCACGRTKATRVPPASGRQQDTSTRLSRHRRPRSQRRRQPHRRHQAVEARAD